MSNISHRDTEIGEISFSNSHWPLFSPAQTMFCGVERNSLTAQYFFGKLCMHIRQVSPELVIRVFDKSLLFKRFQGKRWTSDHMNGVFESRVYLLNCWIYLDILYLPHTDLLKKTTKWIRGLRLAWLMTSFSAWDLLKSITRLFGSGSCIYSLSCVWNIS